MIGLISKYFEGLNLRSNSKASEDISKTIPFFGLDETSSKKYYFWLRLSLLVLEKYSSIGQNSPTSEENFDHDQLHIKHEKKIRVATHLQSFHRKLSDNEEPFLYFVAPKKILNIYEEIYTASKNSSAFNLNEVTIHQSKFLLKFQKIKASEKIRKLRAFRVALEE